MNVGGFKKKHSMGKLVVMRHGHGSIRSHNAAEKVVESQVRQQGRREIQRALVEEDWS